MDLKLLNKLAKECRKCGIAEFRFTAATAQSGETYEFKLWDAIPKPHRRYSKAEKLEAKPEAIPVEGGLTDEQIMFYSAPDLGGGMA